MNDKWLDAIPNKSLVWHSIYDALRRFNTDVEVAIELQAKLVRRIKAIEALKDEPDSVLRKCRESLAWLDDRLS